MKHFVVNLFAGLMLILVLSALSEIRTGQHLHCQQPICHLLPAQMLMNLMIPASRQNLFRPPV